MRWQASHLPKIVRRPHQSLTDQVQPHAIDEHASGQWICRRGHPVGEFAATALFTGNVDCRQLLIRRDRCGNGNESSRDNVAQVSNATAYMNVPVFRFRLVLHAHGFGDHRLLVFQ